MTYTRHVGAGTATLTGRRPAAAAARAAAVARPAGAARPAGTIRAVLADDAPLMHMAVRSMLAAMPGYSLVAAATTVAAAEQLIRRVRPALLICEAHIGAHSGAELCRRARFVSPATTVVLLASRDDPQLARTALAAGARGYLLKSSPPDVLAARLAQAMAGEQVLDERLGRSQPEAGANVADQYGLSRREREVLGELLAGLHNRAIAQRLCIAEDTVKSHMKSIFRKMGAHDRAHAVALALGSARPEVPGVPAMAVPGPRPEPAR